LIFLYFIYFLYFILFFSIFSINSIFLYFIFPISTTQSRYFSERTKIRKNNEERLILHKQIIQSY